MVLGQEDDIQVVAEAGTGLEAIEQAHVHRPDVILMDIRMPDLDVCRSETRRCCLDRCGAARRPAGTLSR
jgi:DNA-binding NarL/FixJ family response regulator